MKKGIKLTSAAFLAVSALTPVAAFANETTAETPVDGFYTADKYVKSLSDLSKSEVKELFKGKVPFVLVAQGTVYDINNTENLTLLLTAETVAELEGIAQTYEDYKKESGKELNTEGGIVVPSPVDPEPIGKLKVESVSAINTTTVKVEFNQAVEALAKADVVVTNKETTAKQVVKEVKLAEDGLSAEVVLYNALAADTTYTVAVKEATTELTVGSLTPATIEAETTQVVQGGAETAIEYKLFDENGTDITKSVSVDKLTFVSSFAGIADGKITLEAGAQTTVTIQYKEGNKILAASEEITVKAEAIKLTSISNWTLTDDLDTVDFEDEDYEQVSKLAVETAGQHIAIEALNQFGKVQDLDGFTIEYTSLDEEVGIINNATSEVVTFEAGVLPVKVVIKDAANKVVLTDTIEITVTEAAVLDSIEADKETVKLSVVDKTVGQKVVVTVKDQNGNPLADQVLTLEDVSDKIAVTPNGESEIKTDSKGQVEFKVTAKDGATKGSYSFKVKAADAEAEIEVEVQVNVTLEEQGIFAAYSVTGLESTLDLYTESKGKKSMTPVVVEVDEKGNVTGTVSAPTFKLLDEKGVEVELESESVLDEAGKLDPVALDLAKGKYTLEISVAGKIVTKHVFEVVNTTPPTAFEFTATTVEVDLADAEITTLKAALASISAIGTEANPSEATVSDVVFTTTNSVVANTIDAELAVGTAKLYISKVVLSDGTEITYSPKLVIDVKVVDTTPEETTPIEEEGTDEVEPPVGD